MIEVENHFTVFIRLPFNRGDFVDPPPVAWSAAKERALWEVISRQGQGKGNEIDWHTLATQFKVTQPFILQQAAWLYERQLSQVRAQLRKVGTRQSATPSPAPGSVNSSMVGGHPMKRGGSGGSRVPSRLSMQHVGSPTVDGQGSAPGTPAKCRTSLPLKSTSGATQAKAGSTSSRTISPQPSKEENPTPYTHSRRGSTQQQLSRSPGQVKLQPADSDSEDDMAQSKLTNRRANPSSTYRRTPSLRKDIIHSLSPKPAQDEDDDDAPTFLPFVAEATATSAQDPGATLRGGFVTTQRPSTHRRSTSERIVSPTKQPGTTLLARQPPNEPQQLLSSSGSGSLSTSQPKPPRPTARTSQTHRPTSTPATGNLTLPPHQQASLSRPRHHHHHRTSESSPSMGSSFSDLDDASVTQSALEEALLSNMGNTLGTNTNTVASRVSALGALGGLGGALRSRYLSGEGRQERGQGVGQGLGHQGQGGGAAMGDGTDGDGTGTGNGNGNGASGKRQAQR